MRLYEVVQAKNLTTRLAFLNLHPEDSEILVPTDSFYATTQEARQAMVLDGKEGLFVLPKISHLISCESTFKANLTPFDGAVDVPEEEEVAHAIPDTEDNEDNESEAL